MVDIELHVARVDRDGCELAMTLRRGKGLERVTVRLSPDGYVHEVWVGDDVSHVARGQQPPLELREDLVGTIARKAREFSLIRRIAAPAPPARVPLRLADMVDDDDFPYPEAADAASE